MLYCNYVYQCLVNQQVAGASLNVSLRLDVEHWTPSSGACKKHANLSWKRLHWGWI